LYGSPTTVSSSSVGGGVRIGDGVVIGIVIGDVGVVGVK